MMNTNIKQISLGDTVIYLPEGRQGRVVGIVEQSKQNNRVTVEMSYGLRSTLIESLKLVKKSSTITKAKNP